MNVCFNIAVIRHTDPEKRKRLIEAYERGTVCEDFLAVPPSVKDKGQSRECARGTCYDFGELQSSRPLAELNDAIKVNFSTKGKPPFVLYLELLRQGFEVNAMYWEPGFELCGRVDGAVVRDFFFRSCDIREIRKHVDATIIEEFRIEECYSDGEEQVYDTDPSESSCDPWEERSDLASFITAIANSRAASLKFLDDVARNV